MLGSQAQLLEHTVVQQKHTATGTGTATIQTGANFGVDIGYSALTGSTLSFSPIACGGPYTTAANQPSQATCTAPNPTTIPFSLSLTASLENSNTSTNATSAPITATIVAVSVTNREPCVVLLTSSLRLVVAEIDSDCFVLLALARIHLVQCLSPHLSCTCVFEMLDSKERAVSSTRRAKPL